MGQNSRYLTAVSIFVPNDFRFRDCQRQRGAGAVKGRKLLVAYDVVDDGFKIFTLLRVDSAILEDQSDPLEEHVHWPSVMYIRIAVEPGRKMLHFLFTDLVIGNDATQHPNALIGGPADPKGLVVIVCRLSVWINRYGAPLYTPARAEARGEYSAGSPFSPASAACGLY